MRQAAQTGPHNQVDAECLAREKHWVDREAHRLWNDAADHQPPPTEQDVPSYQDEPFEADSHPSLRELIRATYDNTQSI